MIRWGLKDALDEYGITAYRLSEELRGKVSRNTVYAMARGDGSRVDLATLNAVLTTLHKLTGKSIGIETILIFET